MLLLLALACTVPPYASAETGIGSPGSGAGQILAPAGVAVDQADGLLYVAENGNKRISVFDADTGAFIKAFGWGVADGTTSALQVCTTTCFKGLAGSGAGQLSEIRGIAVDNDPASPAFHSVYVYETGSANYRVQRFSSAGAFVWMVGGEVNQTTNANLCTAASGNACGPGVTGDSEGRFTDVAAGGIGVGPGGTVHVADRVGSGTGANTRVQKFDPAGTQVGSTLIPVSGGSGNVTGFAIASSGDFYVSTSGVNGAVRKYNPSGTEQWRRMPSFNVFGLAVGSTGDLFAADNTQSISGIYQFSSAGTQVRTFYGRLQRRALGLASYPSSDGDVFAAENLQIGEAATTSGLFHVDIPAAGPVVYGTPLPSSIGNRKATLNARINPEGKSTTFHFEYITDADYQAAGQTFGAGTIETAETALPGTFTFAAAEQCREDAVKASKATECELRAASTPITGLAPETAYHFRAVASSADGSDRIGATGSFETRESVEFGDVWSTAVGTDSATLHAEVNPVEIAATGYFEYVDEESFQESGFASASTVPDVDAGATPLDFGAGTAFVERAATASSLEAGTTYRYRLVVENRCTLDPEVVCTFTGPERSFSTFAPSAPPSSGCANSSLRTGHAASLPDCRAYEMVSPDDKNGSSVDSLFNIVGFPASLNQAAADGQSITYTTYRAFGPVASAPYVNQYVGRRDSGAGWTVEPISPVRQGPSLMTYASANLDRQYKAFTSDLCNGFLIQDANPVLAPGASEGFPGLYRRDNCGAGTGVYEALSVPQLPATAPPNLPPSKFIPEPQGFSVDGSVAIFTVGDNLTSDAPPQPSACEDEPESSSELCEPRLYEAREGQTSFVCVLPNGDPNPGPCSAGLTSASSWVGRANLLSHVISDDGSRIFWTASSSGPGPLYVRIDGTETVQVSSSASATFRTASADGSRAIYSIGKELFEFDVETEVSTLIAGGFVGIAGSSNDASRLYFASTQVLTGAAENNQGDTAEPGQPNLYLYESGAGFRFIATLAAADVNDFGSPVEGTPAARLSRVTPSGLQLAFMSLAPITGYDNKDAAGGERNMEVFLYDAGKGAIVCASCNPTGARPLGRKLTQKFLTGRRAAARIPTFQSQLYGERVISDDGARLYFNSFDRLVARDDNGQEDVYQWERPGAGTCTLQSPTYQPRSGGCVDLISSGESPWGSELVDIGTSGEDVFFKTSESLLGQDHGEIDIYDARVGGGFPPAPSPPAACEGEACAPPVSPPTDQTPASAGFHGPGNEVKPAKPRKPCPRGKRKVRRAGKVRCVKAKKSGKAAGKSRKGGQAK